MTSFKAVNSAACWLGRMPADFERTCSGATEYCENMTGISKALEFPSEVVFQRVTDSLEATSLLHLSATAQQIELTVRLLWQDQQYGLPQVQQHLQRQLDDLLQRLLQLANTLQTFAEHNRDVSQQLQHSYGATSKVAEKLMLAHCEQELAQRARIAGETRATVQLPPFAQVMQQISDHVRQEFIAMSALYAQPAQHVPSAAFTCVRQPMGVTPPGCHYQPHPGFGHSPVPWTNHHEQPVYATDTRLEPQPFNQAQMLSSRPPQSMLGQHHTSPQQLFSGIHCRLASQHRAFVPAGQPAVHHLQAQPPHTSLAPHAGAACRQSGTQAAAANNSSLQHASPAYGFSPCQHGGSALPQSNRPQLHDAPLLAAASSTAPAHCQPHCIVPPQQAAALRPPLHQGDFPAAHSTSCRQLPELVRCPSQSTPFPHDPTPHVSPTSAALETGPVNPATHFADRTAGQMERQSVSAAMPAAQELLLDSAQPSLLQLQQPATAAGQMQQQLSLPLTSGKPAPDSLPASQQLAAPGKPSHAPLPGSHPTGASAPSSAAALSSLLGIMEQGQPAILPSATDAACNASAPNPPTHAAGSISIHRPPTAGHTAALPTHPSDSRPAPVSAPAYLKLPTDMVKPSTVTQRIAWPGEMLATASMSPSGVPGQAKPLDTSPQLMQTTDACPSTGSLPAAAASLPVGMGQAGSSTEQVASDASFRFQAQPNCIQVSAGVCCTPVLRPRSHGVAYAGMMLPAVAVTSTSEDTGRGPQQEVVVPDSEGSPEGGSSQRQEAHAATPPPNGRPIKTSGNVTDGLTDNHLVQLQHSLAQHKVVCHSSSSSLDRSGCSLEALPGHAQPEVCTQSVPAEQHVGPAQGYGVHSQAASQQQTGPPQSMSFAAAFLRHDKGEDAEPRAAAAECVSSRVAAEPLTWPGMDLNTNDGLPQNIGTRSGPEHTLRPAQQAVSRVQHTDASLPGSVYPLAPAPAGPIEHLGDDKRALEMGEAAPRDCDDQQGGGQGPVRALAGALAGPDQQVTNRAYPLDGSQPSSSSLKRVPETPDSAENRSQPTQSPDGAEGPQRAAGPTGPLHVVLVNNSDEQAGIQGVNVAAFLLMDSQKDSTSPGYSKSAQPAKRPQPGRVKTATSAGFGNSQTQQAPAMHSARTATGHDTSQMKVSVGSQLLQQEPSQAFKASDPDQPAMQAAPADAPAAAKIPLPKVNSDMKSPQTCQANTPAGVAARKQPAGEQRAPRWPGSCSQGTVVDANHLHGVPAVVVTAHRSKSCSAGGRQHTAKKLVFQQLSLAQQSSMLSPSVPVPGFRASLTTAAGSDAKAGAAQQPIARRQAASTGAVAAPKQQARQAVVRPVASQAGGKLAEAGVATVPQAVSKAKADTPAAAVVVQKKGSTVSVSQHTEPEGHTETDHGSNGSQEQWETAVSKLRSLAEKHSQDYQEEGAAMDDATDIGPASRPMQEHRPRPPDKQPLARKGPSASQQPLARKEPSAFQGSLHPPVVGSPRHVQGRQKQVAMPGRPFAQAAALPGTAGQSGQSLINTSGTVAHAFGLKPVTKAGAEGLTGLSRLRAFMRQQKQQQLQSDPLVDTGQEPCSVARTVAAEAQNTTGAPQLGQQSPQHAPSMKQKPHGVAAANACQLGETRTEQGHKRKRLEAGACDQVQPHTAGPASHIPSAGAQHKRQCLSASSPEPTHFPAAHGCYQAERHSLVYGQRPAGAAHMPDLNAPHQSGSPQAGITGTTQSRAPLVAWPVGCEPIQAPALQLDSRQQLPSALPVAVATGRKEQPATAAADEPAVKAYASEAAAEVLVGEASGAPLAGGVPSVGQQDASQGGSEAQQGGLRLDLSSEEDPLQCTQKLPSSQGGSGQGLFKTPDDAPSEAQGAALVQLAPAGLANVQSPWNTPALLQPPMPQLPDPASICKPPGSIIHRTDGGHPAPPLSWASSREAGFASCIVPRSAS